MFQLQLHFPKEYPQKPPAIRFLSKIFHPNGQTRAGDIEGAAVDSRSPAHCLLTLSLSSPLSSAPVFVDGALCLDIIQSAWSPIYSVSSILTSIQSLLTDPNIGAAVRR